MAITEAIDALLAAGFDLDTSTLARALYSSDASLQRVVPAAVARPATQHELVALVDAARLAKVPITSRGAGTSIAGNAIGPGLVLDLRHLNRITDLDAAGRSATVEPGVIPARLTAAASAHSLRFGPDPSTVDRCTIGGMIGNNACGARALGYGRSAENVLSLEVITGTGERLHLVSPAARLAPTDGATPSAPSTHSAPSTPSAPSEPSTPSTPSTPPAQSAPSTSIALTIPTDPTTPARPSIPSTPQTSPTLRALHDLVQANLGVIRTEFGRFSRQVSGYSLEHLLPENGFDVARFLAGTEGTLAVFTSAQVGLVPEPKHSTLVAIGYPDMAAAADATPTVLPFGPTAVEGLDRRIVEVVARRLGAAAVPVLPGGDGWLLIELTDDDPERLANRAAELLAAAGGLDGEVVTDLARAARLWQIRADGAGLAAVGLAKPAHSGWEDSAVPPAALGAYLRDLDALLASHGLHGLPYGHFGEGCVHLRVDFELSDPAGVADYRSFVEAAADLVASYGGSISGEHGDGRARSELLGRMYSAEALALFAAVKHLFDPDNLLNPGVLVDPRPLDADLRLPAAHHGGLPTDFTAAVHRCTGVGKCLAPGGVMCPSYQATGREQDSTRGRARTLQEMANGSLITGWRDPAVAEALELCLACKACATECPTGTDIAAAKSRVLAESYRGRLRPRSHYLLGRLPSWANLVTAIPGLPLLVNALLAAPGIGRAAKWLAGVDARRTLPRFAARPARALRTKTAPAQLSQPSPRPTQAAPAVSTHAASPTSPASAAPAQAAPAAADLPTVPPAPNAPTPTVRPVVVWVDPFTDNLDAAKVPALMEVLRRAGFEPSVVARRVDTGVSLISTGQRDRAAATLRRAIEVLAPIAASGVPIVGVDPSCLAVWRSDAAELVDDSRLAEVAASVHTLAELLATATDWTPSDLSGLTVVAQPHCHHRAVLGWDADAALLARTGAAVVTVDGCCGLAGNFGLELGHYETSVAVANNQLLPAIEAAGPEAILLADGFSCRYQVLDLTGRRAITLAELLTGAS